MLCWSAPAIAQPSAIVFQRDTLRIIPKVAPALQTESTDGEEVKSSEDDAKEAPKVMLREPIEIPVEIRGEQALATEWLHLNNLFANDSGMLIMFDEARILPVRHRNLYMPVDILFIDQQGTILQILPDITLSELYQDVYPSTAMKAWLHLKGGSVEALNIQPGDHIDHPLFSPDPLMLQ
tara:strand:+ start:3854 stop:4393 length:540 start_codon:yes stop_codon:yes gene_type:complete